MRFTTYTVFVFIVAILQIVDTTIVIAKINQDGINAMTVQSALLLRMKRLIKKHIYCFTKREFLNKQFHKQVLKTRHL